MTLADTDRVARADNQIGIGAQVDQPLACFVRALEVHPLAVGPVGVAASRGHSLLQRKPRRHGILARPIDFAQNVEGAKRQDLDTDARIIDIAIVERRREAGLKLLDRLVGRLEIADQRKAEIASTGDHIVTGQRFLAKHDDVNLVTGCQRILDILPAAGEFGRRDRRNRAAGTSNRQRRHDKQQHATRYSRFHSTNSLHLPGMRYRAARDAAS